MTNHAYSGGHVILVLELGHGTLGSRLGQGAAREAGTEKSGVSGISLSRAKGQLGLIHAEQQASF